MMKKRPMFVGPIGCGKTSTIQRLTHQEFKYNKTQSVEFFQDYIDTPGEYIEHRRMYTNIATTAMDANVVVIILGVNDQRLIFPQGFSTMFAMPMIGVVNKMDLVDYDLQHPDYLRVAAQLKAAGAKEIVALSAKDGKNISILEETVKKAVSNESNTAR
ncbi:EutP/PduV family microcompartment system protein [uncultured Secundilactobacillus sp.]|uniref:EutP/PduV family microcompartment system protein n=1 Tax=uncultured Secundilactobacillus sp. TaxID=2813935 RepID=UPI00258D86A0|nr:EutP/PduV family microcompartment system protein [uncultured Secundilactobacillus sp.]